VAVLPHCDWAFMSLDFWRRCGRLISSRTTSINAAFCGITLRNAGAFIATCLLSDNAAAEPTWCVPRAVFRRQRPRTVLHYAARFPLFSPHHHLAPSAALRLLVAASMTPSLALLFDNGGWFDAAWTTFGALQQPWLERAAASGAYVSHSLSLRVFHGGQNR